MENEESSVKKLGRACGRMALAWVAVVKDFTTGFDEEAGVALEEFLGSVSTVCKTKGCVGITTKPKEFCDDCLAKQELDQE